MIKKNALLVLTLLAVVAIAPVAYAEETDMMEPARQMDERQERGGKEMMKGKGMMMGMHSQPSMVATSDGGVIVLSGPRLAKYDKDLNLVKELELKGGPRPPKKNIKNESQDAAGEAVDGASKALEQALDQSSQNN